MSGNTKQVPTKQVPDEYELALEELNKLQALLAEETAKLDDLISATARLGPLGEEILREYEAAVAEMGLEWGPIDRWLAAAASINIYSSASEIARIL